MLLWMIGVFLTLDRDNFTTRIGHLNTEGLDVQLWNRHCQCIKHRSRNLTAFWSRMIACKDRLRNELRTLHSERRELVSRTDRPGDMSSFRVSVAK